MKLEKRRRAHTVLIEIPVAYYSKKDIEDLIEADLKEKGYEVYNTTVLYNYNDKNEGALLIHSFNGFDVRLKDKEVKVYDDCDRSGIET